MRVSLGTELNCLIRSCFTLGSLIGRLKKGALFSALGKSTTSLGGLLSTNSSCVRGPSERMETTRAPPSLEARTSVMARLVENPFSLRFLFKSECGGLASSSADTAGSHQESNYGEPDEERGLETTLQTRCPAASFRCRIPLCRPVRPEVNTIDLIRTNGGIRGVAQFEKKAACSTYVQRGGRDILAGIVGRVCPVQNGLVSFRTLRSLCTSCFAPHSAVWRVLVDILRTFFKMSCEFRHG